MIAMRVFIDIETLPPERERLAQYPKLCDCDETEFRKLALDGDYGRVLVIGVIVERNGRIALNGCLGRDRQTLNFHLEERRTLASFWKLLKDFDPKHDTIIGHNILFFDLKILYKRSYINRVQPSVMLSFARYKSQPIFDTMHEWNKWDMRKFISLDELAQVLGLPSSKDNNINGSRVYEQFCEGCHKEIADYCMRDVRLTRSIYYRLTSPEAAEPE